MNYQQVYSEQEPSRQEVENVPGKLILEFGADWCPHCQALQPVLEKIFSAHRDIRHLKISDGKTKRLGRAFQVKVWPNLVFLRDGKILKQLARPTEAEVQDALFALMSETDTH